MSTASGRLQRGRWDQTDGTWGYDEIGGGSTWWVTFPRSVTEASPGEVALTLFWLGGPHVFAFNAPAEHREGWFGLATRAGCASGWLRPDSGGGYVERLLWGWRRTVRCTVGSGTVSSAPNQRGNECSRRDPGHCTGPVRPVVIVPGRPGARSPSGRVAPGRKALVTARPPCRPPQW